MLAVGNRITLALVNSDVVISEVALVHEREVRSKLGKQGLDLKRFPRPLQLSRYAFLRYRSDPLPPSSSDLEYDMF